jgi:hypothetical protein
MVRVDERAKMGRKLEWVATGNSGRCVAVGPTLTWGLMGLPLLKLYIKVQIFFFIFKNWIHA